MKNKKKILLLLSFMLLGLLLRLNNLGQRSLWTDEFFTLFQATGHGQDLVEFLESLSHKQPPELLKASDFTLFLQNSPNRTIENVNKSILLVDTYPPLYFWLMHFWMKLIGDSALAIRLFSFLLGLFAIYLAYKVSFYLFDENTALFSAFFTSISAFAVRYSQEARSYSLITVLVLLSSLFLMRFEKKRKNRDILVYSLMNCLGIYTHYFYIFIAFAQFIYFTYVYRNETLILRKFYLAFICSILLFFPWFSLLMSKGYNFYLTEWLFGFPGIWNKFYYLLSGFIRYFLIIDNQSPMIRFSALLGSCLFIYLVWVTIKETAVKYGKQLKGDGRGLWQMRDRQQTFFPLMLLAVPIIGMFSMDIVLHGTVLRQERFWTFSFPGFMLLVSPILSFAFVRKRNYALVFILCMLIMSISISRMQFGPAPKDICHWIKIESKGESVAVIVINARGVVCAQAYYLDKDMYLIPVSDDTQLQEAVSELSRRVNKIFLARHYHPTDNALLNRGFMETRSIGNGFRLAATVNRDSISVSEFLK